MNANTFCSFESESSLKIASVDAGAAVAVGLAVGLAVGAAVGFAVGAAVGAVFTGESAPEEENLP